MRIEDCQKTSAPEDFTNKIEEEVLKKIKKRLMECEGGSWPCYKCEKYFLGESYVISHVQKKHANKVSDTRKKVIQGIMLDSYTHDKNKIILVQPRNTGRSGKSHRDNGNRNNRSRGGNRREGDKKEWKDLDDLRDTNQVGRAVNRALVEYGDI